VPGPEIDPKMTGGTHYSPSVNRVSKPTDSTVLYHDCTNIVPVAILGWLTRAM